MAFRSAESMIVRQNSNGNYTATWTPSCTGPYHLRVTVDGYAVSEVELRMKRSAALLLNLMLHSRVAFERRIYNTQDGVKTQ